jgi:hypothetical protein
VRTVVQHSANGVANTRTTWLTRNNGSLAGSFQGIGQQPDLGALAAAVRPLESNE